LRGELDAEVTERQRADAAQRELITHRLARAESERRKLLDAYYAGAIDVATLRVGHARIGADLTAANDRLGDLDANLTEWQEILELAATLATRCGDAYRKGSDRTRKLLLPAGLDEAASAGLSEDDLAELHEGARRRRPMTEATDRRQVVPASQAGDQVRVSSATAFFAQTSSTSPLPSAAAAMSAAVAALLSARGMPFA